MPAVGLYAICLCLALLLTWATWVRAAMARARWLGPLLAVTAVIQAVTLVFEGVRIHGGSGLRLAGCVLIGLIVGGLIGRWIRLQRLINLEVQDAAGRLLGFRTIGFSPAIRLVVVLLVLNPAGWLAASMAGLTGDWRMLAWKAVLDAATLVGLPAGPRWAMAVGALISVLIHGLIEFGGGWFRPALEGRDAVGAWVFTSGLVWLTLPLLVLRLRSVPLANLALAVPAAALVASFWR